MICDDLGLANYLVQPNPAKQQDPADLRMKDRADLLEALIGALYVDQGLEACKVFCKVCFFPRLKVKFQIELFFLSHY